MSAVTYSPDILVTVKVPAKVHRDSDGSLWAEVPAFPGCFASGFSQSELLEALDEAVHMWLRDEPETPDWHVGDRCEYQGESYTIASIRANEERVFLVDAEGIGRHAVVPFSELRVVTR